MTQPIPPSLRELVASTRNAVAPKTVALHCGQAILDWLRDQLPRPDTAMWSADPATFTASHLNIPVHVHPDMPGGRWELRDAAGNTHKSGQVGDDGWHVGYVPGVGFVGVNPTVLDELRGPGPL
jgi:hypothetical protein